MTEKRTASIKETGEELPQEQWQRFDAATDAAARSGERRQHPSERPPIRPGTEGAHRDGERKT